MIFEENSVQTNQCWYINFFVKLACVHTLYINFVRSMHACFLRVYVHAKIFPFQDNVGIIIPVQNNNFSNVFRGICPTHASGTIYYNALQEACFLHIV